MSPIELSWTAKKPRNINQIRDLHCLLGLVKKQYLIDFAKKFLDGVHRKSVSFIAESVVNDKSFHFFDINKYMHFDITLLLLLISSLASGKYA